MLPAKDGADDMLELPFFKLKRGPGPPSLRVTQRSQRTDDAIYSDLIEPCAWDIGGEGRLPERSALRGSLRRRTGCLPRHSRQSLRRAASAPAPTASTRTGHRRRE